MFYISPVAYPDFFYWNQQFVKKKPPWFRLDFETFYTNLASQKRNKLNKSCLFSSSHTSKSHGLDEKDVSWWFLIASRLPNPKIFMLNILSPQWISHGRRGLSQEDVPEIVFLLMFRKGLCFDPKVTITRQLGSVFESMCFHGFWRVYDTVYVNKSGGI